MRSWQQRILIQRLPVDDAANWATRNLAKFSRLNAEQIELAQSAATLGELELLLIDPPVPEDTRLGLVLANPPGNITLMHAGSRAKSTPASAPAAYADLLFTALTPCRIYDSRPSQGGAGVWLAGSTNTINIGPNTSYAFQGGSATDCGMTTLIGPGKIAAVMASVSTVNQASAGYLTFFSNGATNPYPYGVTQSYQPGPVQTSFVVIPTDLVGAVLASGYSTKQTNVIIDVVGYFAAAPTVVTSITAGTGLTGGTITSTGTITVAASYQLPQACSNGQIPQSNGAGSWTCAAAPTTYTAGTGLNLLGTTFSVEAPYQLPQACVANQIPKWNGSAWACAADANSGGTVTGVSASAPLASSGGNAPNISLTGTVPVANGGTGQTSLALNGIVYGQGTAAVGTAVGVAGQVLTGTAGAPAWTGSPSISGNLTLVNPSTAGAGNIMKGGNPFIHNVGTGNTFIGENAGNFTMTGTFNTASGRQALLFNTTGYYNTASGVNVLYSNTTGSVNTASGLSALQSNTTGSSNTASGFSALSNNTTGFQNTASGLQALFSNTTGGNNIGIGYFAGVNLTTGDNNIDIGNLGFAAESNTIRIGTSGSQTRAFIAGISGVTTGGAAVAVLVDSNGQLGTISSSRRYKDDIADMDAASSALMKLRPVTFHYKTDHNASGPTLQYGLVAEEVAEVYPGLIAHSADGQVETVLYQHLPTMLLNEYQKQQRSIEAQAIKIEAQVTKIDLQTKRIAELETQTKRIAEIEQDRQMQRQVIAELQAKTSEINALKSAMADMGKMVDQLRRTNNITASLPGR